MYQYLVTKKAQGCCLLAILFFCEIRNTDLVRKSHSLFPSRLCKFAKRLRAPSQQEVPERCSVVLTRRYSGVYYLRLRPFPCHVNIHRYIHTRHGPSSLNLLLQNTIIVILPREFSVGYTGIRGTCGGRTQLTESQVRVLRSCRTYQSARYQYRVRTKPYRSVRQGIEPGAEQIPVPPVVLWSRVFRYPGYTWVSVPNLPMCRVPVSRWYQSVGYRYPIIPKSAKCPGAGIEFVPKFLTYRVPVSSSYRTIPACSAAHIWHSTAT